MTHKPARNKNQTQRQSLKPLSTSTPFEAAYPNITAWVTDGGWIEIGGEIQRGSFVRALDEGGMIWEGAKRYKSVDKALQALERGIAKWTDENY